MMAVIRKEQEEGKGFGEEQACPLHWQHNVKLYL